jgi:hypothetical protein
MEGYRPETKARWPRPATTKAVFEFLNQYYVILSRRDVAAQNASFPRTCALIRPSELGLGSFDGNQR